MTQNADSVKICVAYEDPNTCLDLAAATKGNCKDCLPSATKVGDKCYLC